MADQKITELPIRTSTGINLTDYLLGIDSAEGYQMLVSDIAKKIVEDYAGSTLLGTAQSVASALTQCMGLYGNTRITGGNDLNSVTNFGTYYIQSSTDARNISNVPEESTMRIYVTAARKDANYIQQVAYPYDKDYYYIRNGSNTGSSWTAWIKSPTRSEIPTRILIPAATTTISFSVPNYSSHFIVIAGQNTSSHAAYIVSQPSTNYPARVSEIFKAADAAVNLVASESDNHVIVINNQSGYEVGVSILTFKGNVLTQLTSQTAGTNSAQSESI